ncbi:hypothetical protein [Calothrix sp. CCY 0018]|uniref:hypothetical protein n=1 Tax=Calothrix sp. CCY 0018 TaxID=3103864 RepID=UPI0039C6BF12
MKTQLNLDTAEQTLLISLLGRGKQFERESIEKLSVFNSVKTILPDVFKQTANLTTL